MRVRRASFTDIPALAAIAEASYRAAFRDILEQDVLEGRNATFFAQRFQESWPRIWIAEAAERPTGFILMTDGHIDMLFMDPAAQGQGGGALLLRKAEEEGARSLECFFDNHAARRFYERHGWHPERVYQRDFAGWARRFVLYGRNGASDSGRHDPSRADRLVRRQDNL